MRQQIGPYNTPLALGREPLTAFFWVVLAPVLFLTGAGFIAAFFAPDFNPGTAQEIEAYQLLWIVTCLAMAAWFALMSFWSDWLGAGPFAGAMSVDGRWLVIALIVGPMMLLIPNFVAANLMPEEGWQYRDEINRAIFAPANWTIAYIFIAVVMAPVVEEVAFRGIAFGALIARGFGPAAAVLVSSLAFALSHLQYSVAAMSVVFVTGVGFAILRLVSGTVIVPIVAHAAANADVLLLNWLAASAPPT